MGMQIEKHWTIRGREQNLGPLSSYALTLWGVQGLLYPQDVVMGTNRAFRAGYLPSLQKFMRNNGHLSRPYMWSVAGGKGGVGKSIVSALTAIALAQRDSKVVLVDADFGGANQREIFGVTRPVKNIWQILNNRSEDIDNFLIPSQVGNLQLLLCEANASDPFHNSIIHRLKFIQMLRCLEADYVILDLGPRMLDSDLDYYLNSDVQINVSSPEMTSIQNVSRFLKRAFKRKIDTAIYALQDEEEYHRFEIESENYPIQRQSLEFMQNRALPNRELLKRVIDSFNVKIIFNMISEHAPMPGKVLSKYLNSELGIHIDVLGSIPYDPVVRRALHLRNISLVAFNKYTVFSQINRILDKVLDAPKDVPTTHTSILNNSLGTGYSTNEIICGSWCSSWGDCDFQNPGYRCPIKNE